MDIEVKLLHYTPMPILINAIRTCYDSTSKSDSCTYYDPILIQDRFSLGIRDKTLIEQVVESGHTSTLEHINFNFHIKGISRLNLQELARHRMASLSVKSTRYTLKELKNEAPFIDEDEKERRMYWDRSAKYINFINVEEIDLASITALENLRKLVASGKYKNDFTKYALPECYRLELYWSVNLRSLLNFLDLREDNRAHFEIHETATKVRELIPKEFQFIIEAATNLK